MSTEDDIEGYVDYAAMTLNLPVDGAHRPGVVRYMRMVAAMASEVNDFPLDAESESAAIFTPCSAKTQE
jgi:hypothetical protein